MKAIKRPPLNYQLVISDNDAETFRWQCTQCSDAELQQARVHLKGEADIAEATDNRESLMSALLMLGIVVMQMKRRGIYAQNK
jgi:hypothetical protein